MEGLEPMLANMRSRSAVILSGTLAVVVFAALHFSGSNAKAGSVAETALPRVAVALAVRQPLENTLTLSGAFRPYQQVDVHAKVAGFIRKIYVDVGDQVTAG